LRLEIKRKGGKGKRRGTQRIGKEML